MSDIGVFDGFHDPTFEFLRGIAANNDKAWFDAHKKDYKAHFVGAGQALAVALGKRLRPLHPGVQVEPRVNGSLFRINRDIRFSKDKTPYNTHVWAGWHPQGVAKGSGAGFHFGFSHDSAGVGCGAWSPDKARIERLRAHLAEHYPEWTGLLGALDFEVTIGTQNALKRVPKPYPPDHPAAELLKMKGVHLKADLPPSSITSEDLVDQVSDRFRQLSPIVAFMNRGLGV